MSLVLNVEILGEFKKLTAATSGAGKDLKGLNTTAGKISKGINTALGAIGVGFSLAFLVNEFKESTKAAIEDRKSQELLANQLKNSANATDAQVKAVEKSIGKMQIQAAVADDTLRPAFAQLTRATGDTAESTKLLELALDISAGTGKSLETVTMGLTKAYNGQFGALTKLGVPMSDQILNASLATKTQKELNTALRDQQIALETFGINSEEYAKATQKVTDKQDLLNRITADGVDWQGQLKDAFEGSADAAAKTDPYAQLQIIFGEIQEQMGTALLPILERFSTWLATPEGQEKMQQIADDVAEMLTAFTEFVGYIFDKVVPALKQFIGDDTKGIVGLGASLSTAGGIIYFLLNSRLVMLAASNPIMAAAIAGVALIAAGMLTVYNNTKAANTQIDEFNRLNSIRNATSNPLATPEQINAATYQGILNAPTGKPTTTTTAPRGGIPTGNIVINNQTVVNTASTNASGVVSSLQAYQNQTGATLQKLLK